MPGKASKQNARHVHAEQRRALVIELRERGATYRTIVEVVRQRFPDTCPPSYNERQAYYDVRYVLDCALERQAKAREPLRQLHFQRLERMHLAFYPLALQGDNDAFAKCYKVLEREAKLFGLDAVQMGSAHVLPIPEHHRRCLLLLRLVQEEYRELAPDEATYLAWLARLQARVEAASALLGLPASEPGGPA